jgi:hypothetical protein
MKLADFMHMHSITPQQLRTMLGVKSRSSVLRYISGERLPAPNIMDRISELSGGAVTPEDFLDPDPPKCVRVVIDRHGREQTIYPWTVLETRPKRIAANDNRPPILGDLSTEDWPSPPLRRAFDTLGSRVRLSKRGGFLLDGRIADTKRVITAANRILLAKGQPPIRYPGVEPLE